jgi:hypothetical protein
LPNYDLDKLKTKLLNEYVTIKLDFYLDSIHFDKNSKAEHKNIDNLCKIPIDSIYENIAGNIKKDWLVCEIVAKKRATNNQYYTEVEITKSD